MAKYGTRRKKLEYILIALAIPCKSSRISKISLERGVTKLHIFSVTRQYDEHSSPVVYFHFETDQCWINHGAQFVMEELTFAKVNY